MRKAKSSKQYPVKVVPHRPGYRFFCSLLVLMLFVVAVLVSGYLGYEKGAKASHGLKSENQQLERLYQELEQLYSATKIKAEQLQQQVTNLTLGSQVDREAEEDIRSEIVVLKARVAELEQETAFYRGLMRPNADNRGLTIGSLDIVKTNVPRRYGYKLVIQQLATRHRLLKGYLEFAIVGRKIPEVVEEINPTVQKIALKDVSKDVSVVRIPLQFTYFQRFEGELVLPVKFEPERIEIKAVSTGRNGTVVEKKFSWLVQEI